MRAGVSPGVPVLTSRSTRGSSALAWSSCSFSQGHRQGGRDPLLRVVPGGDSVHGEHLAMARCPPNAPHGDAGGSALRTGWICGQVSAQRGLGEKWGPQIRGARISRCWGPPCWELRGQMAELRAGGQRCLSLSLSLCPCGHC